MNGKPAQRKRWMKYFLEGFLSPIDLLFLCGDEDVRFFKEPMMSDAEAIASDWRVVGDDIRSAMTEFAKENNL